MVNGDMFIQEIPSSMRARVCYDCCDATLRYSIWKYVLLTLLLYLLLPVMLLYTSFICD